MTPSLQASADVTVAAGTIRGAVMAVSGGSKLLFTSNGGVLDGVTVNGEMDLTAVNSKVDVWNHLTLNGTATLGNGGKMYFVGGSQTLRGAATVEFQSNFNNALIGWTNGMTLTIDAGVIIRGGGSGKSGGVIGGGFGWNSGNNVSVVNLGTISADVPGQSIHIAPTGTGTLTSLGTLGSINGGILTLGGSLARIFHCRCVQN